MNTQRTRVKMAHEKSHVSDQKAVIIARRKMRRVRSAKFPVSSKVLGDDDHEIGDLHDKEIRRKGFADRGFTLIEVLVVIGIIAILAGVVLVAVNPARQFKLARDSQRTSNVEAILNAIHQNMAEHRGVFVCGTSTQDLPNTFTDVRNPKVGDPSPYLGDIAACVTPDYISSLPYDPIASGAHFNSALDYDTHYEIARDSNGRITASSSGELTPTISATR